MKYLVMLGLLLIPAASWAQQPTVTVSKAVTTDSSARPAGTYRSVGRPGERVWVSIRHLNGYVLQDVSGQRCLRDTKTRRIVQILGCLNLVWQPPVKEEVTKTVTNPPRVEMVEKSVPCPAPVQPINITFAPKMEQNVTAPAIPAAPALQWGSYGGGSQVVQGGFVYFMPTRGGNTTVALANAAGGAGGTGGNGYGAAAASSSAAAGSTSTSATPTSATATHGESGTSGSAASP